MKLHTNFGDTKIYSQSPDLPRGKIFVVPGFGETTYHSQPLLAALVNLGYAALAFTPPRKRGERFDPIERQSRIITEVLKANLMNNEKVYAVAHSLGSSAVLKAAKIHPEYFASLTLMQPAGIITEQQSIAELAGRTIRKIPRNQKLAKLADKRSTSRVARSQFNSATFLVKSPIVSWREAVAAGRYSIIDDLKAVTDLRIPVHLVVSKGDEMFDYDKVEANRDKFESLTNSFTILQEPTANHDTFWIHPELTAKLIDQLISQEIGR
jgi:alpha-beta hydrolase superfamily lysophospholipase